VAGSIVVASEKQAPARAAPVLLDMHRHARAHLPGQPFGDLQIEPQLRIVLDKEWRGTAAHRLPASTPTVVTRPAIGARRVIVPSADAAPSASRRRFSAMVACAALRWRGPPRRGPGR
jgi:hypothetical protein